MTDALRACFFFRRRVPPPDASNGLSDERIVGMVGGWGLRGGGFFIQDILPKQSLTTKRTNLETLHQNNMPAARSLAVQLLLEFCDSKP